MFQKEGPGWRLARDPSRTSFPVLIGGDHWAVELTEAEGKFLVSLILEIVDQHQEIVDQLMVEESVSLEIERDLWWACLDGNRFEWSLQVIMQSKASPLRGFEVYWPIPAAKSITSAMRTMWDCKQ